VIDVVQGLALCLLLVLCPWLLWELVDFVGDRVGGPAASGGVASRAASTGTSRATRAAGGAVGTAGAAVGTAVGAMIVAAAHLGRHFPGGSTSGGSGGGTGSPGPTNVPRPETDTAPDMGSTSEDSARRDTPTAVPASVGVGGTAGGADQIPPKPPANRGRVVASGRSGSTPAAGAGSTPADRPAPVGGSASADSGGNQRSTPPRMPPPA
jgi:hypothetical protein